MVFSAVSFCSNQWNVTNLSLYGKTGTRTPFLVILSPDSITFIFFFGFILFCFVLFCFEFSPSCSCWYIVGFLLRLVNDWLCQRYDFFFLPSKWQPWTLHQLRPWWLPNIVCFSFWFSFSSFSNLSIIQDGKFYLGTKDGQRRRPRRRRRFW